jgi:hypothetical protein
MNDETGIIVHGAHVLFFRGPRPADDAAVSLALTAGSNRATFRQLCERNGLEFLADGRVPAGLETGPTWGIELKTTYGPDRPHENGPFEAAVQTYIKALRRAGKLAEIEKSL